MRFFSEPDVTGGSRDVTRLARLRCAVGLWPGIAIAAGMIIGVLPGCGGSPTPPPKVEESKNAVTNEAPKAANAAVPRDIGQQQPLVIDEPALPNPPVNETPAPPQQVFRPKDARVAHDDRKLAELGIRLYESKRLKLYTDIDPTIAATLPPVIDQAYDALVQYFGPLPPDRARTEFQMTGYLIKDDQLFREVGLIPEDLPPFEHGRHRRNEFWMREQKYDYYRRHLLIHEVTHCFMTVMPESESLTWYRDAPVWYMEGMAESFGTHRMKTDGTVEFQVMPTSPEEFAGAGRITAVHNDFVNGKAMSITDILDLKPVEFLKTEQYAWSWALCTFLDMHPRYQQRFRRMGGSLQGRAFPAEFQRQFGMDARDLAIEWALFSQNLQYGYDARQAVIDFQPGQELDAQQPRHEVQVQADRGWQSSGVLVREGRRYQLTAQGRFELASIPKPWISEPQGISFRYFDGKPIGLLLGCIRTEAGEADGSDTSMLHVYPIGRGGTFQAPLSGTLYLRLNDDWNSLHDNKGTATVEIRAAE